MCGVGMQHVLSNLERLCCAEDWIALRAAWQVSWGTALPVLDTPRCCATFMSKLQSGVPCHADLCRCVLCACVYRVLPGS